jgi:hypothetical protein
LAMCVPDGVCSSGGVRHVWQGTAARCASSLGNFCQPLMRDRSASTCAARKAVSVSHRALWLDLSNKRCCSCLERFASSVVRASALHAEGHWFDPSADYCARNLLNACMAQFTSHTLSAGTCTIARTSCFMMPFTARASVYWYQRVPRPCES